MFRLLSRMIRRLRCRHRWRPNRNRPGRRYCDICGARGRDDPKNPTQ